MSDLTVIVPTRERPDAACELAQAFADTCTAGTRLLFAVDTTDPRRHDYLAALLDAPNVAIVTSDTRNMVQALNPAASTVETRCVGFMGDDHRPRTTGWDEAYADALCDLGTGMVYGDDLVQRDRIPTQIAMTADIVRACGWMCPPDLVHLFVDNWWKSLGDAAGCIRYLPDVVVEHVHPVTGKVGWDEGHQRVNQPAMYAQDGATFARLRVTELPRAVAAVKALRGGR